MAPSWKRNRIERPCCGMIKGATFWLSLAKVVRWSECHCSMDTTSTWKVLMAVPFASSDAKPRPQSPSAIDSLERRAGLLDEFETRCPFRARGPDVAAEGGRERARGRRRSGGR